MTEAEKLYREYRTRLLAFVRRRVGNPQAAEDILQDVFVKLLARGHTVQHPGKLRSWLYQVTRNAIVDHLRGARRHEPLPDELPADGEDSAVVQELAQCLNPLIRSLPAVYREAVQMSEIGEVPLKQAARALGVSLPGVKSRVQRGRRKLKAMLLECCRVEVSRHGRIAGYDVKSDCC